MSENNNKTDVIVMYNQTRNIGTYNYYNSNGEFISCDWFKVDDGKEIIITPPEDAERYKVAIPADLDPAKQALIIDTQNQQVVNFANGTERVPLGKGQSLSVTGEGAQKKVKELSEKEKLLLLKSASQKKQCITSLHGEIVATITEEELERIFPTNIPASIYSIVDPKTEIGVARFIADQVYHLTELLEGAEYIHHKGFNYSMQASKAISTTRTLTFSHRFTATSEESASKIAKNLKEQLNGIMRKAWLAAWSIGDAKKKHEFKISILEWMRACYPDRESNFSSDEIESFYQMIKSMKPAEFVLVNKSESKGKKYETKHIISFLQVYHEEGEQDKTPTVLGINLYNVTPIPTKKERSRHLGAAIKRTTLKLHAKDTALAIYVQTRISQLESGGKKKKEVDTYDFQRSALIRESSLQKTNASNPRMANKCLLEKLERLKEEGILKEIPKRIREVVNLKWWPRP